MTSTGGAIKQLVYAHTGEQDIHLTGQPKHNFLKQVYKQYNNLSIEQIKVQSDDTVDFGKLITFNIPRSADFLKKIHFSFSLPTLQFTSGTYAGWTNEIGHSIILWSDLKINKKLIDRKYGLFMAIWDELTNNLGTRNADDLLIGKYQNVSSLKYNALQSSNYYVHLPFWFSQNIASALPLFMLNMGVEITIQLDTFDNCVVYDGGTPPTTVNITEGYLSTDQIYVDDSTKRLMKGEKQFYIIKQLQEVHEDTIGKVKKLNLPFNHPISQLIFVLREKLSEDNNDWFNFSSRNTPVAHQAVSPLIQKARLHIEGDPFTDYQTSNELSLLNSSMYYSNTTDKHIYTIPFCDKPEVWYPNGTLNFSQIDNADLYIKLIDSIPATSIYAFAVNFNYIEIENGFVHLLYEC